MKRRVLITISLLMIVQGLAFAYSDTYYSYKTVIQSMSVCGPVTATIRKVDSFGNIGSAGRYSFSSGSSWGQRVKINEASDCNGNSCNVELHKVTNTKSYPNGIKMNGGSTVYHRVVEETWYYTITRGSGTYRESSSNTSSGSSSYGGSSYSSNSRAAQLGSQMGAAAMQMQAMERLYDDYHAGGFSLAATVSPTWGENLELRFRYGSSRFGGDVTGMIGYDWINNKNIGETYKLNWSAGIGMYFGGRPSYLYLWDVDLGVKFGKSSKPYNNAWTAMIDLSTTHLVGPEHVIGLIAGAGIGLGGNGKRPDFVWDVRGGIVIYFLQWNWL